MFKYIVWILVGAAVGVLVHLVLPAGQAVWVWPIVGAAFGASRVFWSNKRKKHDPQPVNRYTK